MRLVIVPRWGGSESSDFYPWLCQQVTSREPHETDGLTIEFVECVPRDAPEIESSLNALQSALSSDSIVLAHSVGVQAVLRTLARSPSIQRVRLVAVAPWFTVDRPWPSLLPWINTPFSGSDARGSLRSVNVLLSDNDPFTADFRATKQRFEVELDAEVTVCPGAKHFNARAEASVLDTLNTVLARAVTS